MQVTDVEIGASGRALAVVLDDGRRRELGADLLWLECPSAAGKVRRAKGVMAAPEALAITSVQRIGHYGVNIAFSDGHDRGIYPWSYLAALAARAQIDDFITA